MAAVGSTWDATQCSNRSAARAGSRSFPRIARACARMRGFPLGISGSGSRYASSPVSLAGSA